MCNQKHQALFLALLAFLLPSVLKADNVAKVGDVEYETLAAAIAATTGGETVSINKAGTYTLPGISNNITVKGEVDGVVFNHTTKGSIASIPNGATFQNVKFTLGNVDYHGFEHAGTINMENCTIDGKLFSYGDMIFTNCQFTQSNKDYHMWCYSGNVTYTGCTFTNNATGKFLNVYNEGIATVYKVTVNGCKFVNNAAAAKAALNVKATCGSKILQYAVEVNNCTTEGAFPAASSTGDKLVVLNNLVQVDDRTSTDKIVVTQDGEIIYENGTAVKTMEIGTVEELKAFRDAVNGGTQFKNTKVVLTADLDLSSEENWKPIGNLVAYPGQSFDGTFDGNGHVISNLTAIDNTPNHAVAALFGSVVNGTIKNLTVKNVNIQSTHFAAGIVAYTSNTPTIENCHVIGGTITSTPEIVGTSYDNGDKVGGIMGYATAGSTITGCSVEGVNITGYRDLGGICGYTAGTVTNCTVKNVAITQDDTNGYKDGDMLATTVGKVVGGRSANAQATNEANTTENVVLKHVGVVAKIGNNTYTTFEAAFAAAQDGETITLLADCSGNGIIAPQGKFANGLTVDFGGHTYTINGATLAGSTGTKTQAFQLLKDNTITFKNGAIVGDNADVKMMIQNYSNLTLDGMTLDATQGSNNIGYVLSTNNGTTTIKDTKITAKSTGWAFDACSGWGSYQSNSVELTGTSEINGNIEVSYFGQKGTAPASLTLTAGTLNGNIVMAQGADKCTVTKSTSFTAEAPKDYKWVEAESGMQKLVACEYVAQVGEDKYETFEAAAEAAGENVITLLADIEDNYTLTSGKTLKVNKNGKTLNVVAAEGSILDETTDGDVTTYTAALASETDIVLVDGEPYTFTADTQVKSATYTRKYAADRVGKFQAWSMPFDFTITEEAAEKFTFYRINMIAHSADRTEEVESTDKLWVYVAPMKAGEKLTANRPYAYKPKTEGEFTFTADNNKLFAPDYTSRLHTETVDHSYDFYGTYDTVSIANQGGDFYYLNADGEISHAKKETTTVGSYRWIVKATNKSGANYAPRFEFVEEGAETEGIRSISAGDDVEGYYTLGGTRVEKPHHGMFVVKYKNGNIKKQFIK